MSRGVKGSGGDRKPERIADKNIICTDCERRVITTLAKAKEQGWTLWVGGARCLQCTNEKGGGSGGEGGEGSNGESN